MRSSGSNFKWELEKQKEHREIKKKEFPIITLLNQRNAAKQNEKSEQRNISAIFTSEMLQQITNAKVNFGQGFLYRKITGKARQVRHL